MKGYWYAYYCPRCFWFQEADETRREPVVEAPCENCGHPRVHRPLFGEDLAALEAEVAHLREEAHAQQNAMNTAILRLERRLLKGERGNR